MSINIDRTDGLSSSVAVKGPCVTVSKTNLTLSGLQTVNGFSLSVGDRVLVAAQTDATENGIYVADSGPWRRSRDFSRNDDVREGTLVNVTRAVSDWGIYRLTTLNPINIGTSEIEFATFPSPGTIQAAGGLININNVIQIDDDAFLPGAPTVTTPPSGNSSGRIATTEFVATGFQTRIDGIDGGNF